MPREHNTIPLEKVTINLIEGDKHTLEVFYPEKGWSVAARQILHEHCNSLRELESQKVKPKELELQIDLPFLEESGL